MLREKNVCLTFNAKILACPLQCPELSLPSTNPKHFCFPPKGKLLNFQIFCNALQLHICEHTLIYSILQSEAVNVTTCYGRMAAP